MIYNVRGVVYNVFCSENSIKWKGLSSLNKDVHLMLSTTGFYVDLLKYETRLWM